MEMEAQENVAILKTQMASKLLSSAFHGAREEVAGAVQLWPRAGCLDFPNSTRYITPFFKEPTFLAFFLGRRATLFFFDMWEAKSHISGFIHQLTCPFAFFTSSRTVAITNTLPSSSSAQVSQFSHQLCLGFASLCLFSLPVLPPVCFSRKGRLELKMGGISWHAGAERIESCS